MRTPPARSATALGSKVVLSIRDYMKDVLQGRDGLRTERGLVRAAMDGEGVSTGATTEEDLRGHYIVDGEMPPRCSDPPQKCVRVPCELPIPSHLQAREDPRGGI